MSARILEFPISTPGLLELLELEGYTLIAWRRGVEGDATGIPGLNFLYGLWKPADGKGWYQSGHRAPESESRYAPGGRWPAYIACERTSRVVARKIWHQQIREPYHWRHLMSEEEAFPERRTPAVPSRRVL